MERNEKDLNFFKRALEEEEDPERRRLILIQIREVETNILNRLRAERARVQQENAFMQQALDEIEAHNKKWTRQYLSIIF